MKKHYLIMVVWCAALSAAESIPSEEITYKAQSSNALNQLTDAIQKIQEASAVNIPGTLLMRDEQGNCAVHIITADLQGNAATATYATQAGQAEHASSANQAQQATHATQADKATSADQALQAQSFTEPLSGDVIGSQQNTVVQSVGGQSATTIATAVQQIQQATSERSTSTLVCRDAKGDLSACNVRATLLGNATTATCANTFHQPLVGDVGGKQFATVVNSVGGQSAAQIAAAVQIVQSATPTHAPNTLIQRDGNGDCAAHIITADLQGNAATATHATSADSAVQATHAQTAERATQAIHADQANTFTEPLSGDVVGGQQNTVVATIGGCTAAQVATAVQMIQSATTQNISQTIVSRDASGDFAAHIITADLHGNAATATHAINADQATQAKLAEQAIRAAQSDKAACALCAQSFTEPLSGDVIGNQNSTVVRSVGGQSATTIATAVQQIQQATSECSNNMLVCRDAQGDFSARNIKATLLGHATTATHANTFNKPLAGDVVGKQFATVVQSVGGQSAAQIAAAVQMVQLATTQSAPHTILSRDAHGDCAAHIITADLQGNAATATHATSADSAVQATHAQTAERATQADKALQADHATSADRTIYADTAMQATNAEQATQAIHAVQSDKAACALCAQTFTEPLSGDVVGGQQNTVVATIGGCTAAQVAAAVQKIETTSVEEKVITYRELIDALIKQYPAIAHRNPCELSVVALLRVLVAVIGEQQKRLESIENRIKMH